MVCTGESYKTHVKVTFAKGASIKDPKGIFNSSLDGNARRACSAVHAGSQVGKTGHADVLFHHSAAPQSSFTRKLGS